VKIEHTVLPVFVLSLTACGGDALNSFEATEALPEVRVEGMSVSGALPVPLASVMLDVENTDTYKDEDFDILSSVQIVELELKIAATSESATDTLEDAMLDNFSFMSEISINVVATINGKLQTALIGSLPMNDTQFDAPNRTLLVGLTGADISRFLAAPDGYFLEFSVQGMPPPDTVIFDGSLTYDVGIARR